MTAQNPSVLAAIHAAAEAAAEVSAVDITETGTGGGGQQVLETGKYLGRLVEYVEYGSQKNRFEPNKPPRSVCRVAFAVFPFETKEDGTRSISTTPVFIRSSDLTISNHEKATLKVLYNRLNWRNDTKKTHVAMFLGDAYFVDVVKRTPKGGTKERNYLDLKGVGPAVDPMSGQPYNVPAVEDKAYRAFFWDVPTPESWESLYIEGSNDDGTSRNFVQEQILAAVDFPGSPLEMMLQGTSSIPAPTDAVAATPAATPAVPETEAAVDVPWEEPAAPAAPAAPAPAAPVAPEVPTVPQV